MNRVTARAKLLARAETLYLRIAVRSALRQFTLLVLALGAVVLALAMLTIAAFLALSDHFGPIYGALLTGLGLLLLAFVVLFAASKSGGGAERRLAAELREQARQEMAAEFTAAGSFAREALAPSGLAGLAALLLRPFIARLLRQRRRTPPSAPEA